MTGQGYFLDIDQMLVGGQAEDEQFGGQSFVGILQNLRIDGKSYFDYLTVPGGVGTLPAGVRIELVGGGGAGAGGGGTGVEVSMEEKRQAVFAVTFRGRHATESLAGVDSLQVIGDTKISLMLKTSVADQSSGSDGILLYTGRQSGYNTSRRTSRSTG